MSNCPPIFSGKTSKELAQVTAEQIVLLKGKYSEEGKKAIKDNADVLGKEKVKELREPANWIMALKNKMFPEEEQSDDLKNNMGPK